MSIRSTSKLLTAARLQARSASSQAGPSRLRFARFAPAVLGVAALAAATLAVGDSSATLFEIVEPRWTRLQCEAAAKPDAARSEDDGSGFREDPETAIRFPLTLPISLSAPKLTLVGLGVRKVSFLRVKVYSVGFYLEDSVTKNLTSVEGWHTFTANHLLQPPSPHDAAVGAPQLTGEALMEKLLGGPVSCAVRIVPVRNTDFGHLRDGFTRALAVRQKLARQNGELSEADETRIAESIQSMKSIFPAQSVPKGKSLVLVRTSTGNLVVEYEGKLLGQVNDPWVAREMMVAYFADKDVISPKLKEDVAHGLEKFTKHIPA